MVDTRGLCLLVLLQLQMLCLGDDSIDISDSSWTKE
jgi:hypothetical protein